MRYKLRNFSVWVLRVLAAIPMLQTLFFKFSGAPESIYIFSSLKMEPWGRYTVAVFELIASVLLLFPRTTVLGAIMGMALMGGAIYFHLTSLGIVVQDDAGQLFGYACVTMLSCLALLFVQRHRLLPYLGKLI